MAARIESAALQGLMPLPASIAQLTSVDEVLRRRGAGAVSFGCDELFELNDRMLQLGDDLVFVFRYEDLRAIGAMPHVANVPSQISYRSFFEPFGISWDDPDFKHIRGFPRNSIFTAMPDVHDAVKPTFARPLMPKGMPPFARLAEEIADDLVLRFTGAGEIDFAGQFAQTLAFEVWARVLGMSMAERDELRDAMKGMAPISTPGELDREILVALDRAIERYIGVLVPVVRRARQAGSAAFLEAVAHQYASIQDPPPGMPESVDAMVATSLFDAFHALGASLASCVFALVSDLGAHRAVREDPGLTPAVVAEALRLYAPVRMISRYAMSAFEYEGLRIPAGTTLALNWGAGGRDPNVYAEPLKFDLARHGPATQAFGAGGQICPGRNVVRTLCAAGLAALTRPEVSIELVGDATWFSAQPLTYNTCLTRLPMIVGRT